MAGSEFFVYIVLCNDDSLYTGIAKNVATRLAQHQSGRGARYTRAKGVKGLVLQEGPYDHSAALKRERTIKKLSREAKLQLCRSFSSKS